MIRLEDDLAAAGFDGDPDEFRDGLVDIMFNIAPNWSDEELLHHPDESKRLCNLARRRFGVGDLPDCVILRTLTNIRKSKKRSA